MGDLKKIQHLYRRAGFGLSPLGLSKHTNLSLSQAVDLLFAEAETYRPLAQIDIPGLKAKSGSNQKFLSNCAKLRQNKNMDWLNKMTSDSESCLREKMTLFWHGHFACHTIHGHVAVNQNNVIRQHALGNFRDLVLGICRDPGMLRYLNAATNKKDLVNENFGRELLELFTIGIGNYTQKDVVEASRAFTGWSYSKNQMEYLFNVRFHDENQKEFLGKKGNFNGEDIIDMVLEKKAAARFITQKIYSYFVNENAPSARIDVLAEGFYQSGYDIGRLMKSIYTSDWFYDIENQAIKIKSPIELIGGIMKVFNIQLKDPVTNLRLESDLGQVLFEPPSVAGWPNGKLWINNSNIFLRINLARFMSRFFNVGQDLKNRYIIRKADPAFHKLELTADTSSLVNVFGCCQTNDLLESLANYLLPSPPLKFKRNLRFSRPEDDLIYLTLQLMSLPEYQVC